MEIRFPPETLLEIDKKLLEVGSDRQKTGQALWVEWLHADAESGAKAVLRTLVKRDRAAESPEHAHIHDWLEEILRSGHESTIRAIIANIKTFVVQARLFKGDVDMYLRIERKVEKEDGAKKAG